MATATLEIRDWVKTPDGIAMIQSEKHFVLGGRIWQGYKGVPVAPLESQVSTMELQEAEDVDGTKASVWKSRRQRIEGRYLRKMEEYDKRRSNLRRERSEIRQAIREDKELGLPVSSDDKDQILRIEQRMKRLVDLNRELDMEAAAIGSEIDAFASEPPPASVAHNDEQAEKPRPHPQTVNREKFQCEECGAMPPADYPKAPEKWLRGHTAGKHRQKVAS